MAVVYMDEFYNLSLGSPFRVVFTLSLSLFYWEFLASGLVSNLYFLQ